MRETCFRRTVVFVSLLYRWPMNPSLYCSYERSRSKKEDTESARCKCYKESLPILAVRGQDILTAVGAHHVCRQGEICDRATAWCARKIEQPMRPSDAKGIRPSFALNAHCGGGSIDSLVQTDIRVGMLGTKDLRFRSHHSFHDWRAELEIDRGTRWST